LAIYISGRAPHSGLGNLALERALQDTNWLRARLAPIESGDQLSVQDWSRLAVERARLDICWASTATANDGVVLERQVLDALRGQPLWNRLR
jgi:hypothetical protein